MPLNRMGRKIEREMGEHSCKKSSKSQLVLYGNRAKMRHMFIHLNKEHPSLKGHMKLK